MFSYCNKKNEKKIKKILSDLTLLGILSVLHLNFVLEKSVKSQLTFSRIFFEINC